MDPGDILPGCLASPVARRGPGHARNTGHLDGFFYREPLQFPVATAASLVASRHASPYRTVITQHPPAIIIPSQYTDTLFSKALQAGKRGKL